MFYCDDVPRDARAGRGMSITKAELGKGPIAARPGRRRDRALLEAMAALALVSLVGCAPAGLQAGSPGGSREVPQVQRTLVMAGLGEAPTFGTKFASTSGEGGGIGTALFQESLTGRDNRGLIVPRLSSQLPELNTPSWRVFADGRMETIYRLRPGLSWHDGAPLTADDFVFTWHVYTVPETGAFQTPQRFIENVIALDEGTVLFRWNQFTIMAGSVGGGHSGFLPLPRHILEAAWGQGQDPKGFVAHSYFKTDYIGQGPYRLERWEPGAFMEGRAFDGYALGRPRIERVRILFLSSRETLLASFLAGEAHYGSGLRFAEGQIPLYQLIAVQGMFVSGLGGPDQPIGLEGNRTWNIHQWYWKE